jgi:hypothetical protein
MTDAATDLARLPTPPRGGSWTRPFTWAIAGVFAMIVVAALAVAAAAAALVGLLVAVAALVLRLAPRRHSGGPVTLEGRRTADGWDVEAAAPR